MRSTIVIAFVLVLGLGFDAEAGPILVNNHSFELPITDRNGSSEITGWTRSPGSSGIWRPIAGFDFAFIPDGAQVAYIQSGEIFQTLAAVLTANTRYDLRVEVGHAIAEPLLVGQFAIQLLAGGSLLAEASDPTPDRGLFTEVGLSFLATASDARLGQSLEIRLVDKDPDIFRSDVNFDNVRLDATPLTSAVPEPSSLALTSIAFFALAVVGRGFKK